MEKIERSSVKLFVGNLPFSATVKTLEDEFTPFGDLIGAKVSVSSVGLGRRPRVSRRHCAPTPCDGTPAEGAAIDCQLFDDHIRVTQLPNHLSSSW